MPKNGELTKFEIEQQDIVDSACYELITQFTPNGLEDVEWNIELIGKIRDALQEVIVDDLKLMTEMEFYPYIEYDAVENPDYKSDNSEMIVTDEQLVTAIKQVIDEIDADETAKIAGDFLGGLCWYTNDGLYSFIPDENYNGALDFIKELNEN
jgi:hypothetical protein